MVHLGTLWYSWIYWSWTTFDGNIDILSQIGLMVFHVFPSKEAQEWYITQGMCQEFQETALGSSKCVTRHKEGNINISIKNGPGDHPMCYGNVSGGTGNVLYIEPRNHY